MIWAIFAFWKILDKNLEQKPSQKVKPQPSSQIIRLKLPVPVLWCFLAVQNSSIGDIVTHSVTDWLTHFYFWHTTSNKILNPREKNVFFSCPEQLNRTHCLSVRRAPLTIRAFTTLQSDPRDLWPLGHLIRVMRRHDLTQKKTVTKTNTKTKTNIFREHIQRAILETWDLWDIWLEWLGHMTRPKKRQRQKQRQWQRQR